MDDLVATCTVNPGLGVRIGALRPDLDRMQLPACILDRDLRYRYVNEAYLAHFGRTSPASMLGKTVDEAFSIVPTDGRREQILRALVEGSQPHATIVNRNCRKDGSVVWIEWHNSALRDAAGRVISLLSLGQDISSRMQAEEKLLYMATHDGLTSLPNRVVLNDRLDSALARARRSRHNAAVMFLDLDRFKDVNDTLGHRIGDTLLRELARRLRAALRQSDLIARISGDEFVMVLEDLPQDEAPDRAAMKVLDEARRPFQIEGHEIHISASLGVALFPEDGDDAQTLLKNADAAMYAAKELGRNSFRLYSPDLAARRTRRLEVEASLRRALKGDQLQLHYQPIMDLASGEVARAEALLRWNDPARGLVMPGAFLPIAEESGLGHEIGTWVLEQACRQARAWRDGGLGNVVVNVNPSPSQLRRRLRQRILEPLAPAPPPDRRAQDRQINRDGHRGGAHRQGQARHQRRGDRRRGPGPRPRPRARSRRRGHREEIPVAFLRREGCGSGQGYLLCRPLPAPELERWLKTHRRKKK